MSVEDLETRLSSALDSRYRVDREVGAGGMAVVYLGFDRKHERPVALKVLRPELAAALGADRFLAEVRLTAQLQHPHILPLFDSGATDGLLFYVMPYVTGGTLRERIEREGQLPVEDALAIATSIGSALEYAHRLGVVHRDLKPENILFQDGVPLLADFGIALAVSAAGGDRLTRTGIMVGTPHYASPEQAVGERALGSASDVYSLATVLYEMLAGEPPFTGPTTEAVIARLLLEPPRPIRTIRPGVPPAVEASILKALAKLPAERHHSVGSFVDALTSPYAPARSWWGSPVVRWSAGVSLAVALAVVLWALDPLATSPAPLGPPRQLTFSGQVTKAALSPDGEFLAYVVKGEREEHVLRRDLTGDLVDTVLTLSGVSWLQWSPDGSRLLVSGHDAGTSSGRVLTVPRGGGGIQPIRLELPGGVSARWHSDGRRVAIRTGSQTDLLLADAETSDTTRILVPGDHHYINGWQWSPDGRYLAVAVEWRDPLRAQLILVSGSEQRQVVDTDSVLFASPQWSADGRALYYTRGTEIRRVRVARGRTRGTPELVMRVPDGLVQFDEFAISTTSDASRLVYVAGRRHSNLYLVGPNGGEEAIRALTTGTSLRWAATVSPDGRRIAFAQKAENDSDIFLMAFDGGAISRLTHGGRVQDPSYLAWSPDGDRLAFVTRRGGRGQIWLADTQTGAVTPLLDAGASTVMGHLGWAPGRRIAYQLDDNRGMALLDPSTGQSEDIVPPSDGDEWAFGPQYAPDGDRLAWLRNSAVDTSRIGVWLHDLRSGERTRLTNRVAVWPRGWSLDGRYLYLQPFGMGSTLLSIDTTDPLPADPVPFLRTPFRDVECTPAGSAHPEAFLCTAFDFVSDAMLIEGDGPL